MPSLKSCWVFIWENCVYMSYMYLWEPIYYQTICHSCTYESPSIIRRYVIHVPMRAHLLPDDMSYMYLWEPIYYQTICHTCTYDNPSIIRRYVIHVPMRAHLLSDDMSFMYLWEPIYYQTICHSCTSAYTNISDLRMGTCNLQKRIQCQTNPYFYKWSILFSISPLCVYFLLYISFVTYIVRVF